MAPTTLGVATRELSIVDESGTVRARLGIDAGGAVSLRLLDSGGVPRVESKVEADGTPLFTLNHKSGVPHLSIALSSEGLASLNLCGKAGESRCTVSANPFLVLIGAEGHTRIGLGVDNAAGTASLALVLKNGKGSAGYLSVEDDDSAELRLRNHEGKLVRIFPPT